MNSQIYRNAKAIALMISLGVGISAIALPANAVTQDPIAAAAAAGQGPKTGSTNSPNPAQKADTLINQVESAIVNAPNSLTSVITSVISQISNIHIPDLGDLISGILNSDRQDQAAIILENGTGTYATKEDLGKQAVRDAATETSQRATLSQTAQQRTSEVLRTTQTATDENTRLGQDSQNRDVTQQILQNLSLQTAQAGQVNQKILEEAQQARVDRSTQIVLNAQIAKELSAINTSDRRKTIADGNSANAQAGLLLMPGGYTIGSLSQPSP